MGRIEGEGAVGIEGETVNGEGITGGISDVSGGIREEEGRSGPIASEMQVLFVHEE